MNPKIQKVCDEIDKTRSKISEYQIRLKDLERQKTEIENADIVAMVRGIDIPPAEFAEFARMFKERQNCAIPDISTNHTEKEEDFTVEN